LSGYMMYSYCGHGLLTRCCYMCSSNFIINGRKILVWHRRETRVDLGVLDHFIESFNNTVVRKCISLVNDNARIRCGRLLLEAGDCWLMEWVISLTSIINGINVRYIKEVTNKYVKCLKVLDGDIIYNC